MKNKWLIALLLFVFCSIFVGCATDTGVYWENFDGGIYAFDCIPNTVSRKFDLPEPVDCIHACPTQELIGKWRCYIDMDSRHIDDTQELERKVYWGHTVSYWYLIECEFRDDGSYSIWRVSKKNDMILPETETIGRWSYADGALSITGYPKLVFNSRGGGDAGISDVFCRGVIEGEVLLKLKWHSAKEFTATYCDADDFVRRESEFSSVSSWGGYSRSGKGWYDNDGCLNKVIDNMVDNKKHSWTSRDLYVVSPMVFKKQ